MKFLYLLLCVFANSLLNNQAFSSEVISSTLIFKGSSNNKKDGQVFKDSYFLFNYSYEMKLSEDQGKAVATCEVMWEPENQEFYTFYDLGSIEPVKISKREFAFLPTIVEMELLIPIIKNSGSSKKTEYVKCSAGKMGNARQKSMAPEKYSEWGNLIVREGRSPVNLSTQYGSIGLNLSYVKEGLAKKTVANLMKNNTSIVENSVKILKVELDVSPYHHLLKKNSFIDKKDKEEIANDDFWQGGADSTLENVNNVEIEKDDFWQGESELTTETVSDEIGIDDFWEGETKQSKENVKDEYINDDFWQGESIETDEINDQVSVSEFLSGETKKIVAAKSQDDDFWQGETIKVVQSVNVKSMLDGLITAEKVNVVTTTTSSDNLLKSELKNITENNNIQNKNNFLGDVQELSDDDIARQLAKSFYIYSPINNQSFNTEKVKVRGKIKLNGFNANKTPDYYLQINKQKQKIDLNEDGSFTSLVELDVGVNTVKLVGKIGSLRTEVARSVYSTYRK